MPADATVDHAGLRHAVAAYASPVALRSLFQLTISLSAFLATAAAMYWLSSISPWAMLALAPIAAGLVVRIFIIQHDCGHRAYFRSAWANEAVGYLCSLVTFTPYAAWQRQHAGHHGNWNNLDRRDSGLDIYSTCLTVAEYRRMSPAAQRRFRLSRHPLLLFLLLPPVVFLLLYRAPFDTPKEWLRERLSVHATNLGLLCLYGGLAWWLGIGAVATVQLPIMVLASIAGAWLFSVQHRFEGVQWFSASAWKPTAAALWGSSFLRLPKVLQWFSGNIGFHHVHHLNPRIPNYRLQACHESVASLAAVPALTLRRALAASRLLLWDEAQGRLVPCSRTGS